MIDDHRARAPRASTQDGHYPRPQLVRAAWSDLCGPWGFEFDDDDAGLAGGWARGHDFAQTITVPFPPESEASGVGDTSPHRVFWYRREVSPEDVRAAGFGDGRRLVLRLGAVDYRCQIWWNGHLVGSHEGGHTPFAVDVTDYLSDAVTHDLVVRVEDDPEDVAQPRGKQDWRDEPHVIWYHRTSGIWQPVWLEAVPATSVEQLHWTADIVGAAVHAHIVLRGRPDPRTPVRVQLSLDGQPLGEASTITDTVDVNLVVPLPVLRNGQAYEEFLWSPERPRLIDAVVEVGEDVVSSYIGLRTAEARDGRFLLNDRPYYVRSVLSQGYWPESHLAAPSAEALRDEVRLIKDLGFNAARVHQKFEDPRFLYWADRLGLLTWGEAPATFTFSATAVERTVREWLDVVRRDYSHPSVVTWVPLNESWGVQHIRHDPRMVQFARALVGLTKALDATRPVVSNDGWEQVDTDIVAIHDYDADPRAIARRYGSPDDVESMFGGIGPAGRPLVLSGDVSRAPVMLTEFGGISLRAASTSGDWGYSDAADVQDFDKRLEALLVAVHASPSLAGFCYTQLTDTLQEANGLLRDDRTPKLDVERIRQIILGPSTAAV